MYKYRHYDEVIMSMNFLTSGAISYNYHNGDDRSCYYCNNEIYCPTYEQCISAGDIPIAVLDIAIVYKGYINYGFEVYYKNKVSEDKKQKLKPFKGHIEIYEIDAHNILKHVKKPDNILNYCIKIL